jgi:hypothetical protein
MKLFARDAAFQKVLDGKKSNGVIQFLSGKKSRSIGINSAESHFHLV